MRKIFSTPLVSTVACFLALAACTEPGSSGADGDPSLIGPAFGHQPGVATGKAMLGARNQSGVKGTIEFTDDGTDLVVSGTASGLDPAKSYVSLIYDNESFAGGPFACEGVISDPTDPDFLGPLMFIDLWTVNEEGTGSLPATTNISLLSDPFGDRFYVPLDKIGTVSIREFNPARGFPLVACGKVSSHGAG